jgi:hypothetical protein
MSGSGNVPYSMAMPVYRACGHSSYTTLNNMPRTGDEDEDPS